MQDSLGYKDSLKHKNHEEMGVKGREVTVPRQHWHQTQLPGSGSEPSTHRLCGMSLKAAVQSLDQSLVPFNEVYFELHMGTDPDSLRGGRKWSRCLQ